MKVVLEEGHLEKQSEGGNSIYDKLAVGELYEMMKQLPAEQKEALTMYEISGLSMEDISKIQGGTLSGVKSRIARARQKLLEILNKSEKVNK
jgi:RNA polymerase sigma-70 factor (ECF subfamily)